MTVLRFPAPCQRLDAPVVTRFTVHGEPMSKARARVVNGHAYTPERTRIAEAGIQSGFLTSTKGHKAAPLADGETFGVSAEFFHATRQRRDIDNMLKLILDGLNGYVWEDDTQVVEIAARKTLVPKGQARTEVVIYATGPASRLTATCAWCKESFPTYPSHVDKVRYCSSECREAYWRQHRAKAARGECAQCSGPTSKKTYTRCRACVIGEPT